MHSVLEEEVYMTQPQGFIDSSHSQYVCKLHKALYGLKQAPRAWFSTLSRFLHAQKFVNSSADTSLFVQHTASYILIVLVYVDDILVTGSNPTTITAFVRAMQLVFSMKDLGPIHYFLGIEFQQSDKGLFLSQSKYTTELLTKAAMLDCKPTLTPIATKLPSIYNDTPFSDPEL